MNRTAIILLITACLAVLSQGCRQKPADASEPATKAAAQREAAQRAITECTAKAEESEECRKLAKRIRDLQEIHDAIAWEGGGAAAMIASKQQEKCLEEIRKTRTRLQAALARIAWQSMTATDQEYVAKYFPEHVPADRPTSGS